VVAHVRRGTRRLHERLARGLLDDVERLVDTELGALRRLMSEVPRDARVVILGSARGKTSRREGNKINMGTRITSFADSARLSAT
jgi:hypothetical protein